MIEKPDIFGGLMGKDSHNAVVAHLVLHADLESYHSAVAQEICSKQEFVS